MLTVTFRGCPTNDPEDVNGRSCSLPFKHFPLDHRFLGSDVVDGDGVAATPTQFRYLIPAESGLHVRSATTQRADVGRLAFFKEQILTAEFLFIYRVYEGLIGTPPALRADYDHSDLTSVVSANTAWYLKEDASDDYPFDAVNGRLPLWVKWEAPDMKYVAGGNYEMTITFLSQEIFTGG